MADREIKGQPHTAVRFLRFPLLLGPFVPSWLCGYESIMQNKPNSFEDRNNATCFTARVYANKPPRPARKKQTQSNPNPPPPNPHFSPENESVIYTSLAPLCSCAPLSPLRRFRPRAAANRATIARSSRSFFRFLPCFFRGSRPPVQAFRGATYLPTGAL